MNTPTETLDLLSKASKVKKELSISKLIVLGVLAGVYIGFGAHFATTVSTGSQDYIGFGLTKLISGMVFSLGLVLVLIAGAELFTGNTLMVVGLLNKQINFKDILKNWSIVFVANLIGSVLLATLIYYSHLTSNNGVTTPIGSTALSIAVSKANLDFFEVLFRGILANWLVCLAIFLAATAKDTVSKICACVFPIAAFVTMGFEHSIANMYFLSAGLLLPHADTGLSISSALNNLLASSLGNIIGGAFFVGCIYWFVYLKKSNN